MANPLLELLAKRGIPLGEGASRGTLEIGKYVTEHPGVIPRVERLKEKEEPTLFTHVFGIPTPFLQLGSYLGMEGWGATAVDIITDPSTYLGGWGSLTRAGKAGRVARAAAGAEKVAAATKGATVAEQIARSGVSANRATAIMGRLAKRSAQLGTAGHEKLLNLLSLADNDVEALKLLDQVEKARPVMSVSKEAGAAAKLGVKEVPGAVIDFKGGRIGEPEVRELLQQFPGRLETEGIRNAIARKGLGAGRQLLQQSIERKKDLSALLSQMMQAGNVDEVVKLTKQIDKLEPSRAIETLFGKKSRGFWKEYFRQAGKGAVEPLGRTVAEQAQKGQRSLLTFQVPSMPGTERTVAVGQPIMEAVRNVAQKVPALAKLGKAAPYVGAAAKAGQRAGAFDHAAGFDSVAKLGEVVVDALKTTPPGAAPPEDLDDIAKVYWGKLSQARGAAAALGNEVKQLMGAKADEMRMVLDDPGKWMKYPGNPIVRQNLKPEVAAKFTDSELELMETLRTLHERVNAARVERGLPVLENYAPRVGINESYEHLLEEAMLKAPPSVKGARKSHEKRRTIDTLEEAFRAGKSERDVGKVYQSWVDGTLRTLARKDAFERIKNLKIGDLPLFTHAGSKAAKSDKYVKTLDPAVVALATHGGPRGPREILVHQDHIKDVLAMFGRSEIGELTAKAGQPETSKMMEAALRLNSLAKRAAFGIDAVQYGAFTERAAGTMGRAFLQDPLAQTKRGAWHVLRNSDQWKRAMDAGLKLQVLDNDIDPFMSALDTAVKWSEKIPIVGGIAAKPFRWWRSVSTTIDKPVWDYYHPSLKMSAFTELYDKGLRDPRFAKLSADEIAQATAAHVNSAFSGLNWERMWVGQAGQKWLRLLTIAPDWTLSTIKVGADLFANQVARVPFLGRDMVAPAARAAYARDYAIRAAILGGALMEMANLATTSDPIEFLKKGHLNGHYMHENEPGRKTQLALPVKEDGKRLYMVQQKNFQDMMDLVSVWDSEKGPVRFFANRLGFVPSLFNTAILGRDSFGYPIVSTKDGPVEQIFDRTLGIAQTFLPSPVSTAIGAGSAGPRPIRGLLELGITARTGRQVEQPEQIDLQNEPPPPEEPVPIEFEAALQQEIQENPAWVQRLQSMPMEPLGVSMFGRRRNR